MSNLLSNKDIIELFKKKHNISLSKQRLHQFRTGFKQHLQILFEGEDFMYWGKQIVYYESSVKKIKKYFSDKKSG